MNSPAGFDYVNGQYLNIDPMKAMFNAAWFQQALHMSVAAFAATGFAVAGVHALMIVRKKNAKFHYMAFRIAIVFATVAALVQPFSGDLSAKNVAKRQPAKLAAMEAHFKTEKFAPLIIGGVPDTATKKVNYAVKLPGMLSFMTYENFNAEVKGLDQIPQNDQPPVGVTHYAFQVMVGLGVLMVGLSIMYFIALVKKKKWFGKGWFLKLFIAATPIGFIAVEAGWTVTEVGRQPWIIQGVMRTSDAVTPMPGIAWSFYLFTAVYFSLSLIVAFMLYRQIKMVPRLYDSPVAG
jgi:cytochrome d ubiquinol oxidase subunit I